MPLMRVTKRKRREAKLLAPLSDFELYAHWPGGLTYWTYQ